MKTWLIAGASCGFGLEIARAALGNDDSVVATARNADPIRDALPGYDDRLRAIALDVTRPDAVDAAVEKAIGAFGWIDILVNNAGYGRLGAFEDITHEDVKHQFETERVSPNRANEQFRSLVKKKRRF